jgi:hypothetical protein
VIQDVLDVILCLLICKIIDESNQLKVEKEAEISSDCQTSPDTTVESDSCENEDISEEFSRRMH